MKTRKAEKARAEEEKPSSDEEDAISVENVKVVGKKSARMFSHVKNSKLPLMELTKNDVPLEGDNLAQALLKTADALKERSQGEDVITVFELTRGSDIPAVVAWLLEWDEDLKDHDDDYVDEESHEELLGKYTFQQFSRLFKNQGKDPYEEWKFLQLAEDIKYTSTEEALRCTKPHWLKWLRKANRHFDKVPLNIESEKIVLKVLGWFQGLGSLKTHLGNLRSELKNERSPDENCPKVYIDEVSELARDLKSKIRLARYSKIMMVELATLKTADALKQTRIVALEAELKAHKKGKETSGGKSSDSTHTPASFSAPNKDEHVKRVKKRFPSLLGNTEY